MADRPANGIFFHGTSTAVLPPSGTAFELQPATVHRGPQVWTEQQGVTADPRYLHLGDLVALMFAIVTSQRLGGDPAIAEVEAPLDRLQPDPMYTTIATVTGAPVTWLASYEACGRVVIADALRPKSRWKCADVVALVSDLKRGGLDTQVKQWSDPTSWRTFAVRNSLQVDSPFAFRDAVGNWAFRRNFTKY